MSSNPTFDFTHDYSSTKQLIIEAGYQTPPHYFEPGESLWEKYADWWK